MEGDSDRLAQVFSNLLTNAAKYSAAHTRILLSAERKGHLAVVRVKDEGFGIEPHMLNAVFELFTQQQQSADRSQGGLGLGLAIVKNLVTLHGGTVRAISEGPGRGSEFVVELPTSSMDAHAMQIRPNEDAAVTRAAGASERVLLVDDNEDAAEMLSKALAGLVTSCGPLPMVRRPFLSPRSFGRRLLCSTSGSPSWTATSSVAGCATPTRRWRCASWR